MAAMETTPAPTAPGTTPPAAAGEPAVPKSKFSCELCGLDLDSGGLQAYNCLKVTVLLYSLVLVVAVIHISLQASH